MPVLEIFHPSVATWFESEFKDPTVIQEAAWPTIQKKQHTLIAAPTGSGKTLAAFFSAINDLVIRGLKEGLEQKTSVLYISPLKALSNDIERNLQAPLKGINKQLTADGFEGISIQAMVRTGDTPAAQRTAMVKRPPHILVTTPESLYLLLTSDGGRNILKDVETVIVDEIHALVGNKRGSHLSLSLERLDKLTAAKLVRIGLSATQKPIDKVARFLVGNLSEKCNIIDTGHKRKMDLAIEVPNSPLGAVMANEVWAEIHFRLIELINSHKTTIIFVNTRRLAERLSHDMKGQLGDSIASHHGSMSREQRFEAEQRLKAGDLKALVATASLELGIDIGAVDLVCQIGSPNSISAFLQRVGRSNHQVDGVPKGKLFPLSRDELVECAALFNSVRCEELDKIVMPEKPMDILAQQIVAEVASRDYTDNELYALCQNAYPYRDLSRKEFDDVVDMISEGFTTRRGRRGAYLHHDKVNQKIRARKNARLSSLIAGGSIPDNFDYDVVMEPTNLFVGTLNEDFAIESMPGDVFQLGNGSWRILRIESSKVRVEDAGGQPPTIPFWLGEAPGRTRELSESVSKLRETISEKLGDLSDLISQNEMLANEEGILTAAEGVLEKNEAWREAPQNWLVNEVGVAPEASEQIVTYLATAKAALGVMPTQKRLVLERFFDEAGDMHLVIHAPFGSRLNRAWGLSLRKRFCRKFNFELQAAATEDAIILSLGSTHSFPLDEVFQYLNPKTVRNILVQALLDAPMFNIRWRWNASTALAILRRTSKGKTPPPIQRMNAEDLVALVFPDSLACLENIAGDREIPDHPLVNQTIHDCLNEAMDIDYLEEVLGWLKNGEVQMESRDLTEASPLAQEIINARPYAFLDPAPLEERRTRAISNRRWLDPSEAKDLGKLDQSAIDMVRTEAWPQVGSPDELHDNLMLSGFLTEQEAAPEWKAFYESLEKENRVRSIKLNESTLWIAIERLGQFKGVYPHATLYPKKEVPKQIEHEAWPADKALVEIIRGRLEILGPVLVKQLATSMELEHSLIEQALLLLENDGFVFRGQYTPNSNTQEWCERRLLARIHRYTLKRLRHEIQPVSSADFMRFLFNWHQLGAEHKPEGAEALFEIIHQLEGYAAPAAAWESDILPARMKDYEHSWLDAICLSGRMIWGRFKLPGRNSEIETPVKKAATPIKTTPITLLSRTNLVLWKNLIDRNQYHPDELSDAAQQIREILVNGGASFFDEIVRATGMLHVQAEKAVHELVAGGYLTADSFTGLRALLVATKYKTGRRHKVNFNMEQAGRWSMLQNGSIRAEETDAEYTEEMARILLRRYGVVFRKLADHEDAAPPWRDLIKVYRLMEARGEIRGGRFVDGVWGEQFALKEAVTAIRKVRRDKESEQIVSISAADPLNLTGILTTGKRIPAYYSNRILYKNGVPIAVKEGKEVKFLSEIEDEKKWELQNALIRLPISPSLRSYLGKA